ncbi:MAG TPA: hypothetical protein VGS41_06430 [Chthonomonadales bacterium]|nr:hypothetical protein [Chthonomonadales bacterium]
MNPCQQRRGPRLAECCICPFAGIIELPANATIQGKPVTSAALQNSATVANVYDNAGVRHEVASVIVGRKSATRPGVPSPVPYEQLQ